MGFSRQTVRWLTRLMLGVMLFAQGIVAANACVTETGATHAYSMSAAADEMAMTGEMSGHCHEGAAVPGNANACLAQNTQGDQVNLDQIAVQAALPTHVVLILPATPEPAKFPSRAVMVQATPLDTGPPLPIRFCSLLN